MRSLLGVSTLPAVLLGVAVGCVPAGTTTDELLAEEAAAPMPGEDNNAYSYFSFVQDTRKCPTPLCGGWFLKSLNHDTTKCFDTAGASCYVSALDWSEAKLPEKDQATLLASAALPTPTGGVFAIVRGRFVAPETSVPEVGRFVITEGWVAESGTIAAGTFVRMTDNGLRCLRAPCPNITEQTLNMWTAVDVAGINFTPAKLSKEQVADCIGEMATADGILVAGQRYTIYDGTVRAMGTTVTAAYGRLGVAE